MTLKNAAFNIAGHGTETVNSQVALAAEVTTAIELAGTANAVAGAKADVTTELGAITTALTALTANQLSNALVVTMDTSLVTTKNQLRKLLDAVYRHWADAQDVLT